MNRRRDFAEQLGESESIWSKAEGRLGENRGKPGKTFPYVPLSLEDSRGGNHSAGCGMSHKERSRAISAASLSPRPERQTTTR